MLDPDQRTLYTDILTPPDGYVLDEAVAATYSVDPTTLLDVPVHLAQLAHRVSRGEADPELAVYEGLRRAASKLTVFCEAGRIDARGPTHLLYGLLEPVLVEVHAPRGGSFHPKFWVLRFSDPSGDGERRIRLAVLSRNLTADRSWDLALQLEGPIRNRNAAPQRQLGELLAALPGFATREMDQQRQERIAALADDLRRAQFELPDGIEGWTAHVLGLRPADLPLGRVEDLAVISPFCSDDALNWLADNVTSRERPALLVSRPETLRALKPETRARFRRCAVLHEAAETEDGEDVEPQRRATGLHAKVIAADDGWNTRLFVGSANATHAALIRQGNVEVMIELCGKRSRLGRVDDLFGNEGLAALLTDFEPTDPLAVDVERRAAEEALEEARRALAGARMVVRCSKAGELWTLALAPLGAVPLPNRVTVRAWTLTIPREHGRDADELRRGRPASLGELDAASITGLIAFELVVADSDLPATAFALNLPLQGAPPEREGAVLKTLLRNHDAFLRYLLLLLSDSGAEAPGVAPIGTAFQRGWCWQGAGMPLLEELTRALSRDPSRLREIGRLVEQVRAADARLLPPGFDAVWRKFEVALRGVRA